MGDQELWRKNIPKDFQGKMGENWDDDVEMGPIWWSTIGIAGSVAFAFVLCWYMMPALEWTVEKPEFSPLAEANERRLPPTPWLQPKPEMEMDDLLEASAERLAGYGWTDQLNGTVHIPVDRAMELMAASFPTAQPEAHESTEGDAVHGLEAPVADEASGDEVHGDSAGDQSPAATHDAGPSGAAEHEAASGEAHG